MIDASTLSQAADAAVQVKSTTGLFTAAGVWTAIIGGTVTIIVTVTKIIPKWLENRRQADDSLRKDLLMRVENLEKMLESERRTQEVERARHEAQMALMRHRLNNSDQCLDALLMLLETSPDKVSQAVAKIKEMRAHQKEVEAVEKATMRSVDITAKEGMAEAVGGKA